MYRYENLLYLRYVMTKKDIKEEIRRIKPFLSKEYFVKDIGLFGSFISGDQTENSDIDLLVEFEKPIGWKFFSLEEYLENIFGRKIDLVTKKSLKKQLRTSILNQIEYV